MSLVRPWIDYLTPQSSLPYSLLSVPYRLFPLLPLKQITCMCLLARVHAFGQPLADNLTPLSPQCYFFSSTVFSTLPFHFVFNSLNCICLRAFVYAFSQTWLTTWHPILPPLKFNSFFPYRVFFPIVLFFFLNLSPIFDCVRVCTFSSAHDWQLDTPILPPLQMNFLLPCFFPLSYPLFFFYFFYFNYCICLVISSWLITCQAYPPSRTSFFPTVFVFSYRFIFSFSCICLRARVSAFSQPLTDNVTPLFSLP